MNATASTSTSTSTATVSTEPASSINFRVERKLRARVDRVATRSGLTVSQLSRLAVERLVASIDRQGQHAIVVPLRALSAVSAPNWDVADLAADLNDDLADEMAGPAMQDQAATG